MYIWEKYKRVFAFGCSYTSYCYPTWANLISNETINAKFYNFAVPGLGNLAISSKIAEANSRYTFCDTDLILVMYTVMFREDRYIGSNWVAAGNIFSEYVPFYDRDFVRKYCDPIGYLIRDMSLLELSSKYIESLPCDSILLKAADLVDQCDIVKDNDPLTCNDITKVYKSLLDKFPISMKEYLFPNGWEARSKRKYFNKIIDDNHPTTLDYYNYLTHIGINLGEDTYQYALEAEDKIQNLIEEEDAVKFPECVYSSNNLY